MNIRPGARLGPYEIVAPLGAGGMGEVYRATDTRLNRPVAIKVLPSGVNADAQSRERFEREAQAIAALNHPHICTLYDVVEHSGSLCLVLEHLDGETLQARLDGLGPNGKGLPLTAALTIASNGASAFAVSDTGTLVMLEGLDLGDRRLVWVDRDHGSTAIAAPTKGYFDPRVSPDGERLAVEATDLADDIWVVDLRRGTTTRLTFEPGENETPAWSPDGRWVAYASSRNDQPRAVYRRASDGSGAEERLWSSPDHVHVDDWSRDGRTILMTVDTGATKTDIWMLSLEGSRKAAPLLNSRFGEHDARLSPDGQWIAYASDESGRPEVYVQRFPSLATKAQISTDGGAQPVWSRDGRRLFYRGGGKLMAVEVGARDPIEFGSPSAMLDDSFVDKGTNHTGYDVSPDSRRFIFARDTAAVTLTRYFDVIQNWLPELMRRAPVK